MGSFAVQNCLIYIVTFVYLCLCWLCFQCIMYKKSLPRSMSRRFSPFFFGIWVSFKSLIHFVAFCILRKIRVHISFLHVNVSFPSTVCWRTVLSHSISVTVLLKISWLYLCWFISGLSGCALVYVSVFYASAIPFCLLYLCNIFWNQDMGWPRLCSSCRISLFVCFFCVCGSI